MKINYKKCINFIHLFIFNMIKMFKYIYIYIGYRNRLSSNPSHLTLLKFYLKQK